VAPASSTHKPGKRKASTRDQEDDDDDEDVAFDGDDDDDDDDDDEDEEDDDEVVGKKKSSRGKKLTPSKQSPKQALKVQRKSPKPSISSPVATSSSDGPQLKTMKTLSAIPVSKKLTGGASAGAGADKEASKRQVGNATHHMYTVYAMFHVGTVCIPCLCHTTYRYVGGIR
jgi:hypothetical protein